MMQRPSNARLYNGSISAVAGRTPQDALTTWCDVVDCRTILSTIRYDEKGTLFATVRVRGVGNVCYDVWTYECNRVCPLRFVWRGNGQHRWAMIVAPRTFRVRVLSAGYNHAN